MTRRDLFKTLALLPITSYNKQLEVVSDKVFLRSTSLQRNVDLNQDIWEKVDLKDVTWCDCLCDGKMIFEVASEYPFYVFIGNNQKTLCIEINEVKRNEYNSRWYDNALAVYKNIGDNG